MRVKRVTQGLLTSMSDAIGMRRLKSRLAHVRALELVAGKCRKRALVRAQETPPEVWRVWRRRAWRCWVLTVWQLRSTRPSQKLTLRPYFTRSSVRKLTFLPPPGP